MNTVYSFLAVLIVFRFWQDKIEFETNYMRVVMINKKISVESFKHNGKGPEEDWEGTGEGIGGKYSGTNTYSRLENCRVSKG